MTTTLDTTHPVLACLADLTTAVEGVAGVEPCYMRTEDKAQALEGLSRVGNQLAELKARVLAVADDVAEASGDRDPAIWLAGRTNTDPRLTRGEWELARKLDRRHHAVAAGMRAGTVSAAQAQVIVEAIEDLPDHLDPALVADAQSHLVKEARRFRPSQLRRLGRRILEVVAPEIAKEEEARKLADQERRAREKMRLRFRPLGDGTTRITGLLPDEIATRLKTYLEAYTNPRRDAPSPGESHPDPGPFDQPRRGPAARRYAEAFAALLEHLDPNRLPEHGGDATTVMVTIGIDQLRQQLATAGLLDADDGTITADAARRLACTAHIIPAVLGGDSEILDLGRTQRLFTKAQRKALRLRDQGCRTEHCTVPAPWTEAHHLRPWSTGGPTDLTNAISLCNFHHHRIHDQAYDHHRLPDGDIRFTRR